ncbi:TetR/AcrR family transcriptional regulator [Pseudomonas akapageensis]|uniref:TetR/AcrR family transcriptional regulator n=1 Tax=Pseudomonas akapageensis TaxID=2609961 RepID=UPI00140C4951|nr:TetR/AcrR family transcriptional regulator [Pseudomonas akapageensis]
MNLFWLNGYATTSISQLVEATGVTATSLYAIYGDKEGLFRAAVEHYWAGRAQYVEQLCQQSTTAREAVHAVLAAAAEGMLDEAHPPGCMLALSTLNCPAEAAHLHEFVLGFRRLWERNLAERIQRGVEEGDVPRGVDVAVMVDLVSTVIYGMSIRARDGTTSESLRGVADALMAAWPGSVDCN